MSTNIRHIFPELFPSRTKIVATVGPASESEDKLAALIRAGVDVFRLNMAHNTIEQAQPVLERIRKVSRDVGFPVAVLADLAGPKMRLGELPGDMYLCEKETPVRFVRGTSSSEPDTLTSTYQPLIDELEVGNRIMLADGTVALKVVKKENDAVICEVVQGGPVRSRQGVNLPGAKLSVRTLQPRDIENAKWAVNAEVDFLGMSFVRSAGDVDELRRILLDNRPEGRSEKDIPHIISKIEKPEAVARIEEITAASDGIMVARGDLGVEVDIARIAVVQKQIIKVCRRHCKPVIVATQMLESMHHQTLPTRAETTDVANAILDGTDACMLSGESAIGEYPVEAVQMMHRIAVETEKLLIKQLKHDMDDPIVTPVLLELEKTYPLKSDSFYKHIDLVTNAMCNAAVNLTGEIEASLLLVASSTGKTTLNLSKKRHATLTLGTSTNEFALRRMNLYWGVLPVAGLPTDPKERLDCVVNCGKSDGYLEPGDHIVMIDSIIPNSDTRNVLYVHQVT
ncbi:MAG: pyruvate kinase [Planctomycetaceae bacterium]|nr:pyruvate kinase [Planctomycetaceae bacterium]